MSIERRAAVSFARVPLNEIGAKAREIEALGWEEESRGDPWAVVYRKVVAEGEDSQAVLRGVMGAYWLTAEELRDRRVLYDRES
jgi:hypothetical protein